jgi:hypothetical protein
MVRKLVVLAVTGFTLAVCAPAASAAQLPFVNWQVSGKLHLAKLDQDVNLPRGSTFNGSLDFTTNRVTGHVAIPRFTQRLTVLGAVPVDATLELVEAFPVSAKAKLGGTTTIDGQDLFTVYIRRLQSPLLNLNLVSNQCRTSTLVLLPLHYAGPLDLTNGFTFNGTTTIPQLTDCGVSTALLNLFMAGPGNSFSVRISPPAS